MKIDIDDMLGGGSAEPADRLPARRLDRDLSKQSAITAAAAGNTLYHTREFFMPVGRAFFAEVLGLNPLTIDRRLRRVKPIGYGGGIQKRPVYDFRKTLPYLIKSKMDTATLLESLNPSDLPPMVNKTMWEAKRIRLKYEVEAGQAWATEDVLEVFGTVFMAIKERTKLWSEDLREQCKGKTGEEVLAALDEHIDAYQTALHSDLIDIPKKRQTRSKLAEVDLTRMGDPFGDEDDDVDEIDSA